METERRDSFELVLEYPHPVFAGKKIDCVVMNKANEQLEAIEFKYFPPRENHAASAEGVGGIFADCYRLLKTNIPKKTIVIVSWGKMTKYILNIKYRFDFLFEQSPKEKLIDKSFLNNIKQKGFHEAIISRTCQKFKPYAFSMKQDFLDCFDNSKGYIVVYDILDVN